MPLLAAGLGGRDLRLRGGLGRGRGGDDGGRAGNHLFKPGGLAGEPAQVIDLGAADLAGLHQFDLVYAGGMHRKNPFHTHPVGDLADGERLGDCEVLGLSDGD